MIKKSEKKPLVTFVTPVYNGEPYIRECVQSVLAQTYSNWEYIILNNASTDHTGETVEAYAAKDPRITVFENKECLPVIENWNTALQFVSPHSVYCKIVHADDYIYSQCTEKMVAVAEQHPDAGLVGAQRMNGDTVDLNALPTDRSVYDGRQVCRESLQNGLYVFGTPTALLIRSEIIRSRPRFYDEDFLHADTAACYDVLRQWNFGFVHEPLTFNRSHKDSVSTKVASRIEFANYFGFENLAMLDRYGKDFFSKPEHEILATKYRRILYRCMARHWLRNSGGEALEYQRRGLEKFGYGFRRSALLRGAAAELLSCLRRPDKVVRGAAAACSNSLKKNNATV